MTTFEKDIMEFCNPLGGSLFETGDAFGTFGCGECLVVSLDSGIEPGTEGVGGRFGLSHAGEGDQDGHHDRKEGLGESGVFRLPWQSAS